MVDPNAATLVGVIAGGLIAFSKDIVAAIRGYAMNAQLGKVTDQLAASAPTGDGSAAPADAVEAADQTAQPRRSGADHNRRTVVIELLIILIIVGAVLYLLRFLPLDPVIRQVIYVIVVVAVLIYVLRHLAVFGL
jgi:hypothetical protein